MEITTYDNLQSGIHVGGINSGQGTIIGCRASDNGVHGFTGLNAIVKNCNADNNGQYGFYFENSLIKENGARGNSISGFNLGDCTVVNNHAEDNAWNGFRLFISSYVRNNTAIGNGIGESVTNGSGFYATGGNCSLIGNFSSKNDIGLRTDSSWNIYVSQNYLTDNTTDESLGTGTIEGTGDLANVTY